MHVRYESTPIQSREELHQLLQSLSDPKYREFHAALVPGLTAFYGVRTPALKKVGAAILKSDPWGFLTECPGSGYEEKMLRAQVIGGLKIGREALAPLIEEFIPLVDNWAVCDGFCTQLKAVKRDPEGFFPQVQAMVQADPGAEPYRVRVGLVLLLKYYLGPQHLGKSLALCDGVKSDHYYVNMAQAWLVATAMGADRDRTLAYLKDCHLNRFTYNKAIQKSIESYLVDGDTKEMLKWMRKKE